jgi:hypothetical protein
MVMTMQSVFDTLVGLVMIPVSLVIMLVVILRSPIFEVTVEVVPRDR